MLRIKNVSLTNLVAGADVVPEFIQDAMVPERMAEALIPLMDLESEGRAKQVAGLSTILGSLGQPGASARVADIGLALMDARA